VSLTADYSLEPTPTPTPIEKEKVPCPGCGEMYVKGPGLGRHLATSHPELRRRLPTKCPECGAGFLNKDTLRRHRKKQHGFSARAQPGDYAKEVEPVRSRTLLSADEITRAAAIALWPRGIPHDKFTALLRWHQQTAEFLAEVQ
jgi:uncharacterized C2H2 Zn-finger protein